MAKAVGVDKYADDMCLTMLFAQFGGASGDVVADGCLQAFEAGDHSAEAAAAYDILAVGFFNNKFATGDTLHFALGAFEYDAKLFAQGGGVGVDEVEGGVDALCGQFLADSAADTPDFGDGLAGEGALLDGVVPVCPDDNAVEMVAVAFGQMVAEFSQCSGGGDANAGGYAYPLLDAVADVVAELVQVGQSLQVGKAFVDGVDFDGGHEGGDGAHHAS